MLFVLAQHVSPPPPPQCNHKHIRVEEVNQAGLCSFPWEAPTHRLLENGSGLKVMQWSRSHWTSSSWCRRWNWNLGQPPQRAVRLASAPPGLQRQDVTVKRAAKLTWVLLTASSRTCRRYFGFFFVSSHATGAHWCVLPLPRCLCLKWSDSR